jgi:glutamine synthetase
MVMEGLPDMEAVYTPEDIRPGWQPFTQVAIGDLKANDGTPLPMCGRSALKRAVADWQAMGYDPMVGIELEAFAFQIEPDGSLKPYDTPAAHVYATGPFSDPRGFTDALWEKATAAGFRIDSMNTEYDAPQFEFTLTYDRAVKAADDIFLFRLLARCAHQLQSARRPRPQRDLGRARRQPVQRPHTGLHRRTDAPPRGAGGLVGPQHQFLPTPATGQPVWLLEKLGRGPPGRDGAPFGRNWTWRAH